MSRTDVNRPDPSFRPHEHATAAPTIGKVVPSDVQGLPGQDLDRQPAVRAEAGSLGRLWVQACSLAGRSHTEGSTPSSGQDSYSYKLSDDGSIAVLAIADGLGSRSRSHVGAEIAAVQACATFGQGTFSYLFDGPPGRVQLDSSIVGAVAEIEAQIVAADKSGAGGRDLATTLLVGILSLAGPLIQAVFVRVGDPSALLMQDGRFTAHSLVFGPSKEGPANSLSACLPMKDPSREIEVVRVGELPENVAVVLVTDGVGNDLAASAELRKWFEDRWRAPLDAPGMIDSLRYRRQGSVDDRTAIVMLQSPQDAAATKTRPTSKASQPPPPPPPPAPPPPPPAPRPPTATHRQPNETVAQGTETTRPRNPPSSTQRGRFLAIGGIVLVLIIGAAVWASRGGSNEGSAGFAQWVTQSRAGPMAFAVATDTDVHVKDDFEDLASGWVVTSQPDGQFVSIDGCRNVERGALQKQPPTASCENQITPTLAVPNGNQVLIVQGLDLYLIDSDDKIGRLASLPPEVGDSAVDVAVDGRSAVVVGDGRGVIVGIDNPAEPVAIDAAAIHDCDGIRFVAVETAADGSAVLSATCSGDQWVITGLAPGDNKPCVLYQGQGDLPLPIRSASGEVVLAFNVRGAGDSVGYSNHRQQVLKGEARWPGS